MFRFQQKELIEGSTLLYSCCMFPGCAACSQVALTGATMFLDNNIIDLKGVTGEGFIGNNAGSENGDMSNEISGEKTLSHRKGKALWVRSICASYSVHKQPKQILS